MVRVFAYGKLKNSRQRFALLGRHVPAIDAVLDKYEVMPGVVSIEGAQYDSVRVDAAQFVVGKLFEITEEDLAKLDEWETSAYHRIGCNVRAKGSMGTKRAELYIS